MSDPPRIRRGRARWRLLGRLLPRTVRQRVFEPAFADLLRASLESDVPMRGFGIRALGTFVGCLPPAAVRLFVVQGRPTWLTRLGAAGIAVVLLLRVMALWADY